MLVLKMLLIYPLTLSVRHLFSLQGAIKNKILPITVFKCFLVENKRL